MKHHHEKEPKEKAMQIFNEIMPYVRGHNAEMIKLNAKVLSLIEVNNIIQVANGDADYWYKVKQQLSDL